MPIDHRERPSPCPTSQTVGHSESMITSLTGRLLLIEMPRSPCSVWRTYLTNCTIIGSPTPKRSSSDSICEPRQVAAPEQVVDRVVVDDAEQEEVERQHEHQGRDRGADACRSTNRTLTAGRPTRGRPGCPATASDEPSADAEHGAAATIAAITPALLPPSSSDAAAVVAGASVTALVASGVVPSVPAPGAAATVVSTAVVPGAPDAPAPTGARRAYVGDVLLNSTGPVSAGCRTQPSKRSVR